MSYLPSFAFPVLASTVLLYNANAEDALFRMRKRVATKFWEFRFEKDQVERDE
jgi:hypothetical protein